jgi:hypothetical protein
MRPGLRTLELSDSDRLVDARVSQTRFAKFATHYRSKGAEIEADTFEQSTCG